MTEPTIEVDYQLHMDIPEGDQAELSEAKLGEAVQAAADAAGFAEFAEVTLVITDDEHMRSLNRIYRGLDATTDVLAFAARSVACTSFVSAPEEAPPYLGDIIISLPQARRQAEEGGYPVLSELCLLTVHGTLHLLGFDHAEEEAQRRMWSLQRMALSRLGCEDVAPEAPQ